VVHKAQSGVLFLLQEHCCSKLNTQKKSKLKLEIYIKKLVKNKIYFWFKFIRLGTFMDHDLSYSCYYRN